MAVKYTTSRRFQAFPLLLGTLLCSLSDALNTPAQNSIQKQVNGILRGAVLFPLNISSAPTVDSIEWDFQAKSTNQEFRIAVINNGKLEQKDAIHRFGQHLEMADGTTLKITELELNHSGIYTGRVVFHGTLPTMKYAFFLTVHEPVPEPRIRHQLVSQTPNGCNMTLQCETSQKKGFSVTWKRGSPPSALEESLDWYQLSANGTDLHLFWQPNSTHSTFVCLVSNPVDQKNVSFDLLSICPSPNTRTRERLRYIIIIIIAVVLILTLASWMIWLWKARRKKQAKRSINADPYAVPGRESSPQPQYAEIMKRRSPPEGDESQERDHLAECLDQNSIRKPTTIYEELQMPSEQIT